MIISMHAIMHRSYKLRKRLRIVYNIMISMVQYYAIITLARGDNYAYARAWAHTKFVATWVAGNLQLSFPRGPVGNW